MKEHNQHFIERLIARTIGKGSDIAINPAIIPDMLPDTFHSPEQQFIVPFPSSTSTSTTTSSINVVSNPKIDSELGSHESKETSAEAKHKEVANSITTPPLPPPPPPLIPKKTSAPSPPSSNLKETFAEAKPSQDNVPLKNNITRLVDNNNNNKNTEPKGEPEMVVSSVKEEQSYKQQKPSKRKQIEKKQDAPSSNKNKEQIIPIEEMPSDRQAHALTDTNAADQVNKFSQKRQISKEATVYKKTSPIHPEHMQEYLLPPSPIGLTIPAVKSTEQTKPGLSHRISKTYDSIVAKGKGNQEESKRFSDHTVTINIGHIEVRAIMPQKSSSAKTQPSSPALSLRDYLKKRSEGRLQ